MSFIPTEHMTTLLFSTISPLSPPDLGHIIHTTPCTRVQRRGKSDDCQSPSNFSHLQKQTVLHWDAQEFKRCGVFRVWVDLQPTSKWNAVCWVELRCVDKAFSTDVLSERLTGLCVLVCLRVCVCDAQPGKTFIREDKSTWICECPCGHKHTHARNLFHTQKTEETCLLACVNRSTPVRTLTLTLRW